MSKLKPSLLVALLAALYAPHLAEVTVDRTGTVAIAAESALVYSAGFSLWSKGWTGFTHQCYMPAQLHCTRAEGLLAVRSVGYIPEFSAEVESTVLKSRRAAVVNSTITFREERTASLAWGAWLPVAEYSGGTARVYTLREWPTEVRLPEQPGDPFVFNAQGVLAVVAESNGWYVVIAALSGYYPHFSLEDDRYWGGSSYTIGWYLLLDERAPAGLKLSFQAAICAASTLREAEEFVDACRMAAEVNMLSKAWPIAELAQESMEALARLDIQRVRQLHSTALAAVSTPRAPYGFEFELVHAEGTEFKSESGFILQLHGINYSGLEYGDFSLQPSDLEWPRKKGLNFIRLAVSWAYLEPKPGLLNPAYLGYIRTVVYWAKAQGLYTLVDIHQWRWSERLGGCGMPEWITPDARDYRHASELFFTNASAWLLYARAWKTIAAELAGEKAVLGYDLFNEPMPSDNLSIRELSAILPDFYSTVAREIRKVDPLHMVFINPVWGGEYPTPDPTNIENSALDVHLYFGLTWDSNYGYETTSREEIAEGVAKWAQLSRERNIPVIAGEIGVGSQAYNATGYIRDLLEELEKHRMGYAYFTYQKSDNWFAVLYKNGTEKPIAKLLDRTYTIRSTHPIAEESYIPETAEYKATYTGQGPAVIQIRLSTATDYPRRYKLDLSSTAQVTWTPENRTITIVLQLNGQLTVHIHKRGS
ncbi:MAG: hypothetical protein DRN99_07830 [Thermoproteota archaeon]|nr:MAG: hypothetical protein DRN99_07830 [Candidatus Korarchaeota archaeon]